MESGAGKFWGGSRKLSFFSKVQMTFGRLFHLLRTLRKKLRHAYGDISAAIRGSHGGPILKSQFGKKLDIPWPRYLILSSRTAASVAECSVRFCRLLHWIVVGCVCISVGNATLSMLLLWLVVVRSIVCNWYHAFKVYKWQFVPP